MKYEFKFEFQNSIYQILRILDKKNYLFNNICII